MAEKLNLPKSKVSGMAYLTFRLRAEDLRFGASMFNVRHMEQLHGIVKTELFPKFGWKLTKEQWESPLFPNYFVERMCHSNIAQSLKSLNVRASHFNIDETFTADNERWRFHAARVGYWGGGQPKDFSIQRSKLCDKDWAIVIRNPGEDSEIDEDGGQDEITEEQHVVLWRSPYSSSMSMPPLGPWIPVDPRARSKESTVCLAYSSN
jgi:hypothetical protein